MSANHKIDTSIERSFYAEYKYARFKTVGAVEDELETIEKHFVAVPTSPIT